MGAHAELQGRRGASFFSLPLFLVLDGADVQIKAEDVPGPSGIKTEDAKMEGDEDDYDDEDDEDDDMDEVS